MYAIAKARVRAGGELTDVFLCPYGLKHGEACSPVLFSLFINELTKDITESGKHGIQLAPDLIELLIWYLLTTSFCCLIVSLAFRLN